MVSDNILHKDIRVFKTKSDGPVVEVSNTVLSFPSLERKTLPGKAPLANDISIHLHEFLKEQGVDTHFAERFSKQEQAVFETEQIQFEILLRNQVAGDLVDNFGLERGHRFPEPLVEYFVRPDAIDKKPTRVSESHLLAFDIIASEDLEIVNDVALRVNDLLTGVFFGVGVNLVDIRMEFGAYFTSEENDPEIMLVSELSPDTLTLWDIKSGKALDSSLVFNDVENALLGFKEIHRRFELNTAKASLARQA